MGGNSELHCWKDLWVPCLENFTPTPQDPRNEDIARLMVKDVLSVDNLEWNAKLIREVCDSSSAEAILQLPTPSREEPDHASWVYLPINLS